MRSLILDIVICGFSQLGYSHEIPPCGLPFEFSGVREDCATCSYPNKFIDLSLHCVSFNQVSVQKKMELVCCCVNLNRYGRLVMMFLTLIVMIFSVVSSFSQEIPLLAISLRKYCCLTFSIFSSHTESLSPTRVAL